MNCEHAQALINGEYDEALADRDSLESHVSDCDACHEFRAQMDATVAGLNDLRSLTDLAMAPEAEPVSVPWMGQFAGMLRIAAVLALFAIGGLVATSLLNKSRELPLARRDHTPVTLASHEFEVHLTAKSRDQFIPVAKPTGHPQVHLVWLYTALPKPNGDKPQSAIEMPSADETGQLAHRSLEAGVFRGGKPVA